MHKKYSAQNGFSILFIVLVVAVLGVIGFVGYTVVHKKSPTNPSGSTTSNIPTATGSTTDVPYGSDPQQKLDVYMPEAAGTHPIVIAIHGGGWHAGDKKQFSDESTEIAAAGYVVFDINYRLSTAAKAAYPMQNDDVQMAVDWAKKNASVYKADSTNITLLGGSAGAQLALLNGELINTAAPSTIKKVISLSGPTDFVTLASSGVDILAEKASNKNSPPSLYLGCAAVDCPEQTLKSVSPFYTIDKNCPDVLLFNSTNELVPLSQAQSMQDALESAGCSSTLKVLNGDQHAFRYFDQVKDQLIQFLAS